MYLLFVVVYWMSQAIDSQSRTWLERLLIDPEDGSQLSLL